ncbi:hypothetical protein Tco_0862260, partial [Tanacetum coccineum]
SGVRAVVAFACVIGLVAKELMRGKFVWTYWLVLMFDMALVLCGTCNVLVFGMHGSVGYLHVAVFGMKGSVRGVVVRVRLGGVESMDGEGRVVGERGGWCVLAWGFPVGAAWVGGWHGKIMREVRSGEG